MMDIKAQCVHSDTGLCKSCFDYEMKISRLEALQKSLPMTEEEIEKIMSDIVNKGLMDEKDTATIIKEQAHAIYTKLTGDK